MARTNLKTFAYEELKKKIITCEYEPGSFITEEIIASDLQISRTPARDAIGRLEQEGLLEVKPKHGILISPVRSNQLSMTTELRELYEPYVLTHYGERIPADELQRYASIFNEENAQSFLEDFGAFYRNDDAFHYLIVNACPNLFLRQHYIQIRMQDTRVRYYLNAVPQSNKEFILSSCAEHRAIIDLCLDQQWQAASEKLFSHIDHAKQFGFTSLFQ